MEKSLNDILENLLHKNEVSGCVVSDKQGLCLGYKGTACPESSGILTAVADCAKKLHPKGIEPTVILESNDTQCLIQANDKLIVCLYKTLTG